MERSVHNLSSELERQRSHVDRLCKERDSAVRKEQLLSVKVTLAEQNLILHTPC